MQRISAPDLFFFFRAHGKWHAPIIRQPFPADCIIAESATPAILSETCSSSLSRV
jgi:hypothetical protein